MRKRNSPFQPTLPFLFPDEVDRCGPTNTEVRPASTLVPEEGIEVNYSRSSSGRLRLISALEVGRVDLSTPIPTAQLRSTAVQAGIAETTARTYVQKIRQERHIKVKRGGAWLIEHMRPRWEKSIRRQFGCVVDRLGFDLRYPLRASERELLRSTLDCSPYTLAIYLGRERRGRGIRCVPRPKLPRPLRVRPTIPVPDIILTADLGLLREKQRLALTKRFGLDGGKQHTYTELAELLGLTRQGVNQIVCRALQRLENPARFNGKRGRPRKAHTVERPDSHSQSLSCSANDMVRAQMGLLDSQRKTLSPVALREWLLAQHFEMLAPGEWTPGLIRSLTAAGIFSVGDLTRQTVDDLLRLPTIGRKKLHWILDCLEAVGFELTDPLSRSFEGGRAAPDHLSGTQLKFSIVTPSIRRDRQDRETEYDPELMPLEQRAQLAIRGWRKALSRSPFREWLLTQAFTHLGPDEWNTSTQSALRQQGVSTLGDLVRYVMAGRATPPLGAVTRVLVGDLVMMERGNPTGVCVYPEALTPNSRML